MTGEHADILLVEDNPGDVELMRVALEDPEGGCAVVAVGDGDQAVEYLARPDGQMPRLVVLDWNLPCRSGREVLVHIKQHPHLQPIPVVVVTSSGEQRDMEAAYEAGANGFVVKPLQLDLYWSVLRQLKRIWLEAPGEFHEGDADGL